MPRASYEMPAIDAGQYAFKDGHAFAGSLSGSGTARYADPVMNGRRVVFGEKGEKNRSAVALSGKHFTSAVSGVLCDPGRVFTVEALADVTSPAEGVATLFGAENAAGDAVWRLVVDPSGALVASFMDQTGSLRSFEVVDDFAGAAHHVAIAADIPARTATVFVDYAAALSLSASDFAGPLAADGTRFTLSGGCGGGEISGSVDEVRCVRSVLAPAALTLFSPDGIIVVFR